MISLKRTLVWRWVGNKDPKGKPMFCCCCFLKVIGGERWVAAYPMRWSMIKEWSRLALQVCKNVIRGYESFSLVSPIDFHATHVLFGSVLLEPPPRCACPPRCFPPVSQLLRAGQGSFLVCPSLLFQLDYALPLPSVKVEWRARGSSCSP